MDYSGILVDRHKVKIGVIGAGQGVGATFIAMALAKTVGETKSVTYLEEGSISRGKTPSAYDYLIIDKGFRSKKLWSNKDILKGSFYCRSNLYKGVNWMIKTPGDLNPKGKGKTIGNFFDYSKIPGEFIVIDSPEMLNHMDYLIIVVDPMPSKLSAITESFSKLHLLKGSIHPKVIWLMNKVNPFVDVEWVSKYLDVDFDYSVNLFDEKKLYESEYRLKTLALSHKDGGIAKLATAIILE